jgi:hypothetical protein
MQETTIIGKRAKGARRLATIQRGERKELRFVWRIYHGHPFLEVSHWENKRGRMVATSFFTLRCSELQIAIGALGVASALASEERECANE